jgi:hypothetical protein
MRFELLAATALAPSAAFAVDYLSAEQAARVLFPEATRFEARDLSLDAGSLQRLQAAGVNTRSQRWRVQAALAGNDLLGWVVIDDVIGKFELISYAVGITREGRLKPVEVLSYRESHGHEIRLPAWRRQFEGKTAASALRVGEDIANISGATLSCTHVTDGVRRIAAVVEWARREGRL